ncbi:MAG: polysaccharide deacetylase family protein [Peptococcaceae bacterium]|nr:polysaccharide deacetylase family protein [Peptococcaceae bacterium]
MRVIYVKPSRLGLILFGLCLVLGVVIGSRQIMPTVPTAALDPVAQVKTQEPIMALTVNVDWGEENIPAMLNVFQKEGVKATFFVSGRWAKKNPELLKQIVAAGHELENHGYSHPHPNNISLDENKREILRTEQVIEQITGRKTTFFAPPYGENSKNVLRAARELGYTLTLWTLDTVDWRADSTTELITRRIVEPQVKSGGNPDKRGAIVLMHPKPNTVKALPQMLQMLKNQGFSFVTITQLIGRKN